VFPCASDRIGREGAPWQRQAPVKPGHEEKLRNFAAPICDCGRFDGIVLSNQLVSAPWVIRGGRPIWAAIASFLLGAVGWFVTNFFGRPFLDFLNVRSRVHEEVIFTGNIGPMVAHKPDYERAVESLRRLGAEVQATNIAAVPPLRWLFSICG
jgi:hypothetical protein